MDVKDRPIVGVGVLIFRDGNVLLGLRRGSRPLRPFDPSPKE